MAHPIYGCAPARQIAEFQHRNRFHHHAFKRRIKLIPACMCHPWPQSSTNNTRTRFSPASVWIPRRPHRIPEHSFRNRGERQFAFFTIGHKPNSIDTPCAPMMKPRASKPATHQIFATYSGKPIVYNRRKCKRSCKNRVMS